MKVDYALYLVTDNTPGILGDRNLLTVVDDAVAGGVTVVQLRDKTSETADLLSIATQLHEITQRNGIPLIINDRVDVALTVGAEGVHIGQDDMDIQAARKILGPEAIIGVTASSPEEALTAARAGADYLGIGTVFATPTKDNTKSIIGPAGVRDILFALASERLDVATVCIGGINHANIQRVLYQTATPLKRLDGVAVVSAIMGAENPISAASELRQLVRSPPAFARDVAPTASLLRTPAELVREVPRVIAAVVKAKPLNHNMTNLVVQNFAANVALAIGSSPIMSSNADEAAELAALGGALVVNMGSMAGGSMAAYVAGVHAYNAAGRPVVLDPVGCGATDLRRAAVKRLLAEGYFSVIKGNEAEIATVLGTAAVRQRGVDGGGAAAEDSLSSPAARLAARAGAARDLAARERCVVLSTGAVDVLSDGRDGGARTLAIAHGHGLLSRVTGTGCALGAAVAACAAVERGDPLLAALAAALLYEVAAERAAAVARGPGTFVPAFLDELSLLSEATASGDSSWLENARVEMIDN